MWHSNVLLKCIVSNVKNPVYNGIKERENVLDTSIIVNNTNQLIKNSKYFY